MTWRAIFDDGDLSNATPSATTGAAGSAGAATTLARADHRHAFAPTQNLDMGGFALTNMATPDGTVPAQAANVAYVQAVAQGLTIKTPCRVATTANITLSGTQTIDGVSVIANDRVLVKDQSTGSQNGIYVCSAGAWSRATDADTSAKMRSGVSVQIEEGTVNADTNWVLTTNNPITLGTTALVFTQFNSLGQITAGAALTKSGQVLDWNPDNSTLEVSSDQARVKAGGIANSHISASAAIALSKLATDPLARANHTGTQTASTISDFTSAVQGTAVGGDLTGTVSNAQIAAGAIMNADINASAAIALSKLATDPLARANHTGTQLANTISNFDTQVRTSRLDQMAAPTAELNLSNASAVVDGLKPKSYVTASRPTEQTGRIIYDSDLGRLMVSR